MPTDGVYIFQVPTVPTQVPIHTECPHPALTQHPVTTLTHTQPPHSIHSLTVPTHPLAHSDTHNTLPLPHTALTHITHSDTVFTHSTHSHTSLAHSTHTQHAHTVLTHTHHSHTALTHSTHTQHSHTVLTHAQIGVVIKIRVLHS